MPIAGVVAAQLEGASWIRRMFEEDARLKHERTTSSPIRSAIPTCRSCPKGLAAYSEKQMHETTRIIVNVPRIVSMVRPGIVVHAK